MKTIGLKRLKALQIFTICLALILLLFCGMKVSYTNAKVKDYEKAEQFLAEDKLIEAYDQFVKIKENIWISYRQDETNKALEELAYVAEVKDIALSIKQSIPNKIAADDQLMTSYLNYEKNKLEQSKLGDKNIEMFEKLMADHKVVETYNAKIEEFVELLSQTLQSEIDKNNFSSETKELYLSTPDIFFGDAKTKTETMYSLFEEYDKALINYFAKSGSSSFTNTLSQGNKLSEFYSEHGIKADWLEPQLQSYVLNFFKSIADQNNVSLFFKYAKEYEKNKELYSENNEVASYIKKTYNNYIAEAQNKVNNKKYEEAIALYEDLKAYQDTSSYIDKLQITWAMNEPTHLLAQGLPDASFSAVTGGTDRFNGKVFAVGIAGDSLVLSTLSNELTITSYTASLPSGTKVSSIGFDNSISPTKNSVILLEGSSSTRAKHYLAYQFVNSNLELILDLEADGYKMDSNGLLLVNNPAELEAGQQAWYTYSQGQYIFYDIKPDFVDIAISRLPDYKNVKVRFDCTIFTVDGSTAIVLFNDEYIILTGQSGLQPGYAMITGTYVGEEFISNGDQQITAYKVVVSDFVQ